MHTKTHFSDDIRELLELANEPLCQYFFEGHTKQAASNLFSRKDLQDLSPPPGQFAIHKVVMGSEEKYGRNRNHDGYPRAGLIKNHPTFVKIALCYREHENKDKRKNLGTIKASRWDPKLERVETVSHVHIDKAPEEYEMAKQGKELSFSQSCKVPEDYCSICNHAAPKPELYCGHLKESMGRYLPEFQKYAYASNPNPIFFDESFVKYGADRIARYLEYKFADEGHRKAASAEGNIPETISGSDWSDIIGTSKSMTPLDLGARALLTKLASLERWYAAQCQGGIKFAAASYGYGASFDGDSSITDQDIQALRRLSSGTFFRKAARAGVILPFDVFCAYVQDRKLADIREDAALKSAAATLPAAFSVLDKMSDEDSEHNGCCQEDVDMFSAGSSFGADCDPAATNEIDQIMDKVTADFSTTDQPTADRCVAVVVEKSAAVRAEFRKSAAAVRTENITLDPMVELYASYKIAAIRDIRELCPQCSSNASPEEFAVAQNFRFS